MKIDPNAPAFPAALSMNQHQRYSFLGSVGIPDSSGDYVTFDSLCRMKAAAEEIIAQHATLRASVAELEAERDELKEYNADLRGADELATLFARTLVREEGITVTRALERQREYIAKLEKQSKDYSDLLDVSQGVVRDLRASNAKLTAERDALSAQLRAAGEQEPVAYSITDGAHTIARMAKHVDPRRLTAVNVTPLYAAPVPQPQEAIDAERYRFLLGRVDGDKAQTLFERELDAAILAAKEKK